MPYLATACLEQPCPHPAVDRGRCALHRRTTSQRDYGSGHQRARARLASTLPAFCWYGCGRWLTAGSDWVAAHVIDGDPTSPRVVSCRTCNERAKHGLAPTPVFA